MRRIEAEELAAFLPLLHSKKQRLAERQAEVVAKGLMLLGGGTGGGTSLLDGGSQDDATAGQP